MTAEIKPDGINPSKWCVCQIGAREHYAVPRALHGGGGLEWLMTDVWVPPGTPWVLAGPHWRGRWHSDLDKAKVWSMNARSALFEFKNRLESKPSDWVAIMARNALFQKTIIERSPFGTMNRRDMSLFAYSYAALDLLRMGKSMGMWTVLGQIDPGPVEERIVQEEHRRYGHIKTSWNPAPREYWKKWRAEVDCADSIVVNSEWSRNCLLKEGIDNSKLTVIPLVYQPDWRIIHHKNESDSSQEDVFKILFLGQINLRKGVGRLLEAMNKLKNDPVELMLIGPTEIEPSAWAAMRNVKWFGPVPRNQTSFWYEKADAFILPTLSDGFALTQLEALAYGLPVISSRKCGSVVQDGVNGWVLHDEEPETIAKTIHIALNNRDLKVQAAETKKETRLDKLAEQLNLLRAISGN